MKCHQPQSQLFQLKDGAIAIDWGTPDGDKTVQTTVKIRDNGILEVTEIKVLKEDV